MSEHVRSQPAFATLLALLVSVCMTSANADEAAQFREYIEPLLKNHCYECHSHDSGEASGGLVLDSKAGWSVGGDSGPAIVPGELDKSLLWRVINYQEAGLEMPPDGKLSERDLLLIKNWIQSGANDPRVDGKAAERTRMDLVQGKAWWAFQPLRHDLATNATGSGAHVRIKEGAGKLAVGSGNERDSADWIDPFIEHRLRDAGLTPAPRADRATLIRRLSYDLTGLPPNPSFVLAQEPLQDSEYASLVDEWLSSDAFGEKWGRHWLDVVRYADSNGSSFNVPFHEAWRYRNWVIDALNQNMPIDEFIRKQIAGDLLPATTIEEFDANKIATGYLMLGSKVLGTFDKEQLTLDVIDEQVDVLGKSLLGLTLGCARCHDHKFDPLPQTDYYALAGIFASTATLVDRLGGPKEDESDWGRRGLGDDGDAKLDAFLEKHRYEWVKLSSKRFQAKKKLDELANQMNASAVDPTAVKSAQEEYSELDAKWRELLAQLPPHAMAAREAPAIVDLHLRIRGVAASKGELVPRGFLQVLSYPEQPLIPDNTSGRLELATWITASHNPLTPRVFVNRVWKQLFRYGLVRSVDNFGTTGEQPTHPELLDELAARFVANGWNLKQLVRELVMSETYRRAVGSALQQDPENRLLSHQHRRRLDAEEVRDTMLLLSGQLKLGQGENPLKALPIGDVSNLGDYLKLQDNRRTVYQPVIRTLEADVLQLFDAASNTMVTGSRPRTIVAPQSLYFLNSDFVQESANRIAVTLFEPFATAEINSGNQNNLSVIMNDLITTAWQTIVRRDPTEPERRLLHQYLVAQADGESGLTRHDLMKLCQTILCSTQFQFLD